MNLISNSFLEGPHLLTDRKTETITGAYVGPRWEDLQFLVHSNEHVIACSCIRRSVPQKGGLAGGLLFSRIPNLIELYDPIVFYERKNGARDESIALEATAEVPR
jgi:hypothetical protein